MRRFRFSSLFILQKPSFIRSVDNDDDDDDTQPLFLQEALKAEASLLGVK